MDEWLMLYKHISERTCEANPAGEKSSFIFACRVLFNPIPDEGGGRADSTLLQIIFF